MSTLNQHGYTIELTAIDGDYDFGCIAVDSIEFYPAQQGEVLILRDGGADGPMVLCMSSIDRKYFQGRNVDLYLPFSEGTYASALSSIIIRGLWVK